MMGFIIVGVLIVLIVLFLSVVTTSKAYTYKHTVDPVENNPNISGDRKIINSNKKD
ncbi:YtzI protein [Paenibacillus sp. BSR1-1]|uniref:YtzI protein n=1 Tax=Paenibacillus sp. BSR1-1 TaxID=3020845 RepID=UPI0025B22FD1|nr:YtzI protein [Paenibacillus sp. BSR1-1]MDN3015889.1 YtzI protein [Paenibacillus sp. BSR1-1]